MQEVDIPDIFDVLEGGEDESAVKYLLGFGSSGSGDDGGGSGAGSVSGSTPISVPVGVPPAVRVVTTAVSSSSAAAKAESGSGEEVRRGPGGRLVRKRDTSGLRAIYACNCCSKAFTTKFNLRRHINLHCNISKETGVPLQGPPSAHFVSKKSTGNTIVSPLQPAAPGTGILPVIKTTPAAAATAAAANARPLPTAVAAPAVDTAPLLKLASSGTASRPPSFSISPQTIGASSASAPSAGSGGPGGVVLSGGGTTLKVFHDLNGVVAGNNSLPPPISLSPSSRSSTGGLVITATSAPSAMSSTPLLTQSSPASAAASLPSKVVPLIPSPIISSAITPSPASLPSFTVSVAVAPSASPTATISTSAVAGSDAVKETIVFSPSSVNGHVADSLDSVTGAAATPAAILPVEPDSAAATTKCIEFIVAKIPSPAAALAAPSVPPLRGRPRKSRVCAFPESWVRKAVWANNEYTVFYFNRNGKKFACLSEVVDYFDRLDRDVDESLFDFLPTRQEVDDIRETRRREREAELEVAQRTSLFLTSYIRKQTKQILLSEVSQGRRSR